jgi:hypothetical protein
MEESQEKQSKETLKLPFLLTMEAAISSEKFIAIY